MLGSGSDGQILIIKQKSTIIYVCIYKKMIEFLYKINYVNSVLEDKTFIF